MTALAPPQTPRHAPIEIPDSLPAPVFELCCSSVHPVHCEHRLRAPTAETVLGLAQDHGCHAHGFTKAWYTESRLAQMSAAVRRHLV